MPPHICTAALMPLHKIVAEYQLPGALQTHEMALLTDSSSSEDVLLITQHNSLIKVKLHRPTGRPSCVHKFTYMNEFSGPHGLAASQKYPRCVWLTLQFHNSIVLVDAFKDTAEGLFQEKIELPSYVFGPHGIVESNKEMLWISCKESGHVVGVNISGKKRFVQHVQECDGKPIFVAVHPGSTEVYASLIDTNKLLRLKRSGDGPGARIDVLQSLPIPKDKGKNPVSIVAGPDGNLWVTLLSSGSAGSFGRILKDGRITWFSVQGAPSPKNGSHCAGSSCPQPSGPAREIGLIHMAFDNTSFDKTGNHLRLWLLSSSVGSKSSVDAVFTVNLDLGKSGMVVAEDVVYLSSRANAAHRIVCHPSGLFVTELHVSLLAHLRGDAIGMGRKKLNCGCSNISGGGCTCKCNGDCGCPIRCPCKSGKPDMSYECSVAGNAMGSLSGDNSKALVGWWKLDEEEENIGIVVGFRKLKQEYGGGLLFSGRDILTLFGAQPFLTGATDFTIQLMLKTTASSGIIIQQRNEYIEGCEGEYRLSLRRGKPNFMLCGMKKRFQFQDVSADRPVNDNEWHEVVVVRQQCTGLIFIDGQVAASVVATSVESLDGKSRVFMGGDL